MMAAVVFTSLKNSTQTTTFRLDSPDRNLLIDLKQRSAIKVMYWAKFIQDCPTVLFYTVSEALPKRSLLLIFFLYYKSRLCPIDGSALLSHAPKITTDRFSLYITIIHHAICPAMNDGPDSAEALSALGFIINVTSFTPSISFAGM